MLGYPLWNCSQSAQPPRPPPAQRVRLRAGTRVLVQRLGAKPEHNGKRARMVSFDARTGRYAVFAGRREGDVAQGRVRGEGRVRGGGMRVGGGEQHVRAVQGGAVLLAREPAHGLEGAQAGVHGSTAISGKNQESGDRASVGHSIPDSHSRRSTH